MGYRDGSNLDAGVAEREREMLGRGLGYAEVAALTGTKVGTLKERNRLIYKIDLWEAFQRRIERDGIPNRLAASDAFGYWFSGFFDGEGSITLFTRPASDSRYSEFRIHIRVMLRDDDADVLTRIKDNLQVGIIHRRPAQGRSNPAIAWHVERVQDLAEVIVPLFDRYPLYTKKAKEYALWRPVVLQRYLATLGGYSNRKSIAEYERAAFHAALQGIGQIRTYRAALPEMPAQVATFDSLSAAAEAPYGG